MSKVIDIFATFSSKFLGFISVNFRFSGSKTTLDSTVTLDNQSLRILTLFPNTLVSGTTISMGITCQRRGVLSELFKTDGPNQVMFTGTFMHELFDVVIDKKGI